jgi:hypothetical protein
MTRAIGMLVGTLLMLGVFLLVLSAVDAPTLLREVVNSEATARPADAGIVPAREVPVEQSVDSPAPGVTDSAGLALENQPVSANKELLLDPQRWNQSIEAHETTSHDDAAAVSRYRVWSPFHSEWAANGFARRLVLATDVPVEVVNESPGNYQVVFSYRDDGERQALVERIETVTGLELE